MAQQGSGGPDPAVGDGAPLRPIGQPRLEVVEGYEMHVDPFVFDATTGGQSTDSEDPDHGDHLVGQAAAAREPDFTAGPRSISEPGLLEQLPSSCLHRRLRGSVRVVADEARREFEDGSIQGWSPLLDQDQPVIHGEGHHRHDAVALPSGRVLPSVSLHQFEVPASVESLRG